VFNKKGRVTMWGKPKTKLSDNEIMIKKLESISKSCGFMCAVLQLVVAYIGFHWIGVL